MPGDDCASETHGSLKEITASLKSADKLGTLPPDDLHDAVELLLYRYFDLVRQGIRDDFGALHGGVSWYLTPDDERERALISYQEGHGEWAVGCYSDEVPLWLLVGLLRRIARRKPLGDQDADETISQVDALDAEYMRTKEKLDLEKQLGSLTLGRGEAGTRTWHDTEDDDQ